MTAVDELIQRSGNSALVLRFHRFHNANPHFLTFVLQELRTLKENAIKETSFESLVPLRTLDVVRVATRAG